jgi:hypothetical protein
MTVARGKVGLQQAVEPEEFAQNVDKFENSRQDAGATREHGDLFPRFRDASHVATCGAGDIFTSRLPADLRYCKARRKERKQRGQPSIRLLKGKLLGAQAGLPVLLKAEA